MTIPQALYIQSLAERVHGVDGEGWLREHAALRGGEPSKEDAGRLIAGLKSSPLHYTALRPIQPGDSPTVAAGGYALQHGDTLDFYVVSRPDVGENAGYTLVHRVLKDSEHAVIGITAKRVLLEIAMEPVSAGLAYIGR